MGLLGGVICIGSNGHFRTLELPYRRTEFYMDCAGLKSKA